MGKNSSIQPPENAIVYSKLSDQGFWARRQLKSAALIDKSRISYSNETPNLNDTIIYIENLSKKEREKEIALLKRFPGFEYDDSDSFINNFNSFLEGKDRFQDTLKRLKSALETIKNQKTKKGDPFKGMAPNMYSLFGSYLNTNINKMLVQFQNELNLNEDMEIWTKRYYNLLDQAIDNTINEMSTVITENAEFYGDGKSWEIIQETFNSMPELKDNFKRALYDRIGIKNIENLLKEINENAQLENKKHRKKIPTLVRNSLKLNTRTAQLGGNVTEHAIAAVINGLNGLTGSNNNINYKVYAESIFGQMVKTDTTAIFNVNTEIQMDPQTLSNELNEILTSNTGTLDTSYDKIQQFYNENEQYLKGNFILFINSKNYSLGQNSVIEDSKSGPLSSLPEFLERNNINIGKSEDFLKVAYNAASGAIYEGKRDEIQSAAETALKGAAAKLMFDDYQTIGDDLDTSQTNAIHAYFISGLYIPSSVMFEAIANSMKEASINIGLNTKARVTLPEKIEDYSIENTGQNLSVYSDYEAKLKVIENWEKEWNSTSGKGSWLIRFTIKVGSIINNYINNI